MTPSNAARSAALRAFVRRPDSSRSCGAAAALDRPRGRQHPTTTATTPARRRFNFASSQYASCFEGVPSPDVDRLRDDAVSYLEAFDARSWYDDPVCSILNGEKLVAPNTPSDLRVTTKDSLGAANGRQHHATPSQVSSLLDHVRGYVSPYVDVRPQVRRIEERFLAEHAGFLIGNQAVDFAKQDGVTEMEESVMANAVERRLNDRLFDAEAGGRVLISRRPVFVSW